MFGLKAQALKKEMQQFAQKANEANGFTPDIFKLQRRKRHRLFVHDTLQKGHHMHEEHLRSHDPEYRAVGFTKNTFQLWKKDLGKKSFPVALYGTDNIAAEGPIKGEMWSVDTETIKQLDKLYENGVQFMRVRVPIQVPVRQKVFHKTRLELPNPDGPEPIPTSEVIYLRTLEYNCWMYVGIADWWQEQIGESMVSYHPSENRTIIRALRRSMPTQSLFKPVRMYKPNEEKRPLYYYYSMQEYDDI